MNRQNSNRWIVSKNRAVLKGVSALFPADIPDSGVSTAIGTTFPASFNNKIAIALQGHDLLGGRHRHAGRINRGRRQRYGLFS
jgi:hypothetical protein